MPIIKRVLHDIGVISPVPRVHHPSPASYNPIGHFREACGVCVCLYSNGLHSVSGQAGDSLLFSTSCGSWWMWLNCELHRPLWDKAEHFQKLKMDLDLLFQFNRQWLVFKSDVMQFKFLSLWVALTLTLWDITIANAASPERILYIS